MGRATTDADEVVLLRHIPGGVRFQGKPPPRITSENFQLRANKLEAGVSASKTSFARLHQHARWLLELRRTGEDSRIAWAKANAVEAAGFAILDCPTNDDPAHCIIKSQATCLGDHSGRKKLASAFAWVEFPDNAGGLSET